MRTAALIAVLLMAACTEEERPGRQVSELQTPNTYRYFVEDNTMSGRVPAAAVAACENPGDVVLVGGCRADSPVQINWTTIGQVLAGPDIEGWACETAPSAVSVIEAWAWCLGELQ